MTSETAGPPVGPSPGEHSEVAGQPAAGAGGASQPDAAAAGDSAPAGTTATTGDAVPASDSAPAGAAATAGGTATAVDTASADGTAPAVAPAEAPAQPAKAEKHRKLLYFTLPGSWGAIIFACLSFTPSLLPRGGLIQGVICGITAAIGYGLGVWAAAIWRAFANREPRQPRRGAWLTFIISAIVLFAVAFGLGQYWQSEIRKLMGVTDYNIPLAVASPVIAVLVFWLFVLIGRGLRALYRWVAKMLGHWIGPRAARGVGWLLVVGLTYAVVSGLLFQGFIDLMNHAYSIRDTTTAEGVKQPTTSLRSGGPGSLVPWDTLGYQGRNFIGKGPSVSDIEKFTGRPAMAPIRIYAGLASAKGAQAQAALAVKDLERAGGFQRKYLNVVTTTGSGWVDPALVDSYEYLTDGDCATIAIQYSYLPSWISYLVDKAKAQEAGRTLFDAIYGVWAKLPADHRPKMVISGESLGSFGGEAAFTGANDMANTTDGILFAGPPNFNTLFRVFSDNRDAGSPEVQPIYQHGQIVRFTNDAAKAIPPGGQPWNGTRVLYLMNPSDPIVWWSPNLIFNQPDWISEPPGKDVLGTMFWMPLITFWQVTADLPFATGVPAGHGHRYSGAYVYGWNAVLRPAGITGQDLTNLVTIIAKVR
jgi:uncharacterized membrane protein